MIVNEGKTSIPKFEPNALLAELKPHAPVMTDRTLLFNNEVSQLSDPGNIPPFSLVKNLCPHFIIETVSSPVPKESVATPLG